ncbi:MAG: H-NS histone family protein [Pseudomonadota bacterium]
MAKINLDKLSLDELKALEKDLAKAIKGFESRKRKEAMAAAEAAAKKAGYKLSELLESTKPPKKSPQPAKYRHPENPSVTWSGRGRQPTWFKEAIEAGTPEDDLLIR